MPVRRSTTPAMRGSAPAACGVPALAPLRSRSSKTVPDSDARVTATGLVPVLLPPGVSMPPVLAGSVSTVAVLVALPPLGKLVKRTGTVMTARPPALSWPRPQLITLPATLQTPPPGSAGSVRVKVTGPVSAAPAGRVSVKSVCSDAPGPLLTTFTVQLKGWLSATLAALLALLTRRSMIWRVVVASLSLLLARSVSGSLALVVARLL